MKIRDNFNRIRADRFLVFWNLSLIATLLLPLVFFAVARASNSNDNEGNRNQDGQQQGQYDQYGNYVGQVHWWQFWKRNAYNNNYNQKNEEQREQGAPWWYFWTDDRGVEEEGQGVLVFVYLWTVISLMLLGVFGNRLVFRGTFEGLRWMFISFVNYAFIVMVLIGGLDAVKTEGREIEETGWYGQTSVLLFLTCLFGMIKSIVFFFWLVQKSKTAKEEDDRHVELIEGGGTLV